MAIPGRTTSAAVQALLLNDYDTTNVPLDSNGNANFNDPWINMANEVVTGVIANVETDPTTAYSASMLELIERNLSAHYYVVSDPRTKSESVSGVNASYEGVTEKLFDFTRFGQTAMSLDYHGWLSRMNYLMKQGKWKRRLGVIWIGGGSEANKAFNTFPSVAQGLDTDADMDEDNSDDEWNEVNSEDEWNE